MGLVICESAHHSIKGHTLDGKTYLHLPDYLEDHKAILPVLATLTEEQYDDFGEWLLTGLLGDGSIDAYPVNMEGDNTPRQLCGPLELVLRVAQATPAQLAEAFIETIKE